MRQQIFDFTDFMIPYSGDNICNILVGVNIMFLSAAYQAIH